MTTPLHPDQTQDYPAAGELDDRKEVPMPPDVGAHCPVCDGRNLEQLAVETTFLAQGTLRVILACQHCGAAWRGRYRLTGYDHIERLGQRYPDVGSGDAEAEERSDERT